MDATVAILDAPLRMSFGIEGGPANRYVDGTHHPDLMTSLYLRPQKVKPEMWVNLSNLSRVIAPAVVALGKDIDLIDIAEA